MISIKAAKNWHQEKVKKSKTFVWDQREIERRIYNDIKIYDGPIVEEKKKKPNG